MGQARCYAIAGGTMNLFGCTGLATDSPDLSDYAYAVQAGVGMNGPGRAYLYGGAYQAARADSLPPRPDREIDLYSGGSSAPIYVSPSVQFSSAADSTIPSAYFPGPGSVADFDWTIPALPVRLHDRPIIINRAQR
jgi:hypothetical protein